MTEDAVINIDELSLSMKKIEFFTDPIEITTSNGHDLTDTFKFSLVTVDDPRNPRSGFYSFANLGKDAEIENDVLAVSEVQVTQGENSARIDVVFFLSE